MTVATRQAAWAARPRVRVRVAPPEDDSAVRPLTATLEHPLVLNVNLLSKLDMTAFTKEGLLALSRLCSVPLVAHGAQRKFKQRARAIKSMDEEDRSASDVPRRPKTELKQAKPRKKLPAGRRAGVDAVFGAAPLPEPCRTCGRPEQPERLHSHPPAALTATKSAERTPAPLARTPAPLARTPAPLARTPAPLARTPISKPVPANFKSAEKLRRESGEGSAPPRPRSARPRMVTCYICSREFGTASFPLHEPKCIQKWERENQQLAPELRRKLPEKPSAGPAHPDWNEFAWKAAQAALVPCQKCGRTFNPDRLAVHLRSCKATGTHESPSKRDLVPGTPEVPPKQDVAPRTPPTVPCYICGREFGSRSIGIHEPQCLRKWHAENSALPQALQRPEPQKPDVDMSRVTGCYICGHQMATRERPAHERSCLQTWRRTNSARPEGERLPEPQRPDYRFTETGDVDLSGTWHAIWSNHVDSLVPCRQCGRKFFPDRIERHEAACANLPVKPKTQR